MTEATELIAPFNRAGISAVRSHIVVVGRKDPKRVYKVIMTIISYFAQDAERLAGTAKT
jgi:hypothetical protein